MILQNNSRRHFINNYHIWLLSSSETGKTILNNLINHSNLHGWECHLGEPLKQKDSNILSVHASCWMLLPPHSSILNPNWDLYPDWCTLRLLRNCVCWAENSNPRIFTILHISSLHFILCLKVYCSAVSCSPVCSSLIRCSRYAWLD